MTDSVASDHPAIERIVLARGTRGMARLARHLPPDFVARAARAAWDARARTLITTGFHVAGAPETDGPPGAFFLARGLAWGGGTVGFVAEEDTLALLRALTATFWPADLPAPAFCPFPIMDAAASRQRVAQLAAARQPSLVVAIERCGRTSDGRYLNMRGDDITPVTAQVDELLALPGAVAVGIGDGGNEIGMGCLRAALQSDLDYAAPCVTPVDYLAVGTVSNWVAYGVLAYMSGWAGRDLLPTDAESGAALQQLAALGAVHGMARRPEAAVDGFSPADEAALLAALRGSLPPQKPKAYEDSTGSCSW
ncbi:MAG: DUF4392 domain-containing protein [Chloroflexota bacterium]|nr:DUF4392 domain-containing protein [Chloroflexota bacterium]